MGGRRAAGLLSAGTWRGVEGKGGRGLRRRDTAVRIGQTAVPMPMRAGRRETRVCGIRRRPSRPWQIRHEPLRHRPSPGEVRGAMVDTATSLLPL